MASIKVVLGGTLAKLFFLQGLSAVSYTHLVTVCALFDEIEKQGEEKAKMEMAKSLYADGVSIEKIVKYVKYPVEVIEKWLGLVTM